jgi:hypothetical protein
VVPISQSIPSRGARTTPRPGSGSAWVKCKHVDGSDPSSRAQSITSRNYSTSSHSLPLIRRSRCCSYRTHFLTLSPIGNPHSPSTKLMRLVITLLVPRVNMKRESKSHRSGFQGISKRVRHREIFTIQVSSGTGTSSDRRLYELYTYYQIYMLNHTSRLPSRVCV